MSSRIVNGNKVYLDDVRGRWTVLFTSSNTRQQFASEAEAVSAANKTAGNVPETGLINKDQINNIAKSTPTDTQQGQHSYNVQVEQAGDLAMNAVVSTPTGTTRAGFKMLGNDGIEGQAVVEGPVGAIATEEISNVKKTAAQTTNISILTRKAGDGSLSFSVTQGSPQGMKKMMEGTLKVDATEVSAVVTQSSALPTSAAIAIKPGNEPAAKLKKTNVDIVTKQVTQLKNPIGSTFASTGAGPAGFSFGNLLGTIASIAVGGNPLKEIGKAVLDQNNFVVDPVSNQKVFTPIVKNTGETNISSTVLKGNPQNQQIKPTRQPFDMKANYEEWLGAFTIGIDQVSSSGQNSIYAFEPIDTAEEWETDLINGLAARDITTMVVGWLACPIDTNYSPTVIQQYSTAQQQKKFADGIRSNGAKPYGMQIHYYIRRDGTVHRGRPITQGVRPESRHIGPTVLVWFEAGSTEPKSNKDWKKYISKNSISADQYKSFDIAIQTFLKLVPGGEFVGSSELKGKPTDGPGFDVREYVRTKYNKESVYKDFDDTKPLKSSAELVEESSATKVVVSQNPSYAPSVTERKKSGDFLQEIDVNTGKLKDFTPSELTAKTNSFSDFAGKATQGLSAQGIEIPSALKDITKALTAPITNLISKDNAIGSAINSGQKVRQDLIDRGYKYNPTTKEWEK